MFRVSVVKESHSSQASASVLGTEIVLDTLADDLKRVTDRASASLLNLLDLSTAFDTIDYGIFLDPSQV